MNILVDVSFPDATSYYAITQTVYSSRQYLPRILTVSGLAENMGAGKSYEVSPVTIVFEDFDRHFRNKMISNTNRFLAGVSVIVRDGAGAILRTTKVDEWQFNPAQFVLICSEKINMKSDFTTRIAATNFPSAVSTSLNEVVPMAYGTISKVKAWYVNYSSTKHWLLGITTISTITGFQIAGQTVPQKDGNNDDIWYTAPTTASIGGVTHYFCRCGHGNVINKGDYAYIDVTTPAYTPLQIITDLCAEGGVTVGTNAAFATWLSSQGYTGSTFRYLLDRPMTPSESLSLFCTSFECNWRFDSSGQVEFVYVDRSSISVQYAFQEPEVLKCEPKGIVEPDRIQNEIEYSYDLDYQAGKYTGLVTYNGANQGDWGTFRHKHDFEYLTESVQAAVTAGEIYQFNREPGEDWMVEVQESQGILYQPGDFIRVSHRNLKTVNPVLFWIARINTDIAQGTTELQVIEKNWLGPIFYLTANGGFLTQNGGYRIII